MIRRIPRWAAAASILWVLLATNPAYSQDQRTKKLKSYGSRVGDRDDDVDNMAFTRRTNARLNTRIDNRLDARLDRFEEPKADTKSAYSTQVDDGTKAKR